jgi:hypothetical protein
MNKKCLLLGILLFVIAVVIAVGTFIITNKQEVGDEEVLSMADNTKEAQLLDKVIQSQNRIADCIDEVAKIYQQEGNKELTPEIIAKTKMCKSSVKKDIAKINEGTYLVKYSQVMPEGCGGAGTVSGLLNVEVNINTQKTVSNWQNGLTFSDAAIQDIEKSLEPKDCESFAQYIRSYGTLETLE